MQQNTVSNPLWSREITHVLALSVSAALQEYELQQIWVVFVTYCTILARRRSKAFTGCDTVSQQRQKNYLADMRRMSRGLACILQTGYLPSHRGGLWPREVCHPNVRQISTSATVDETRLDMFARNHGPHEWIPPIRAALHQMCCLAVCGPR